MKTIAEQSGKSRVFLNILILLMIALGIGIYLIITTAVIAKDGVTFIQYAQQIKAAPIKTMMNEFQHPGYPSLILAAHKIVDFIHPDSSILSWVYCGQGTALLFRLFAITALYFLYRQFVVVGMSFWAVMILILLPEPAKYGSDVLSDWPHLFLLLAGFLFLVVGAKDKKWWLFGFAGLAGGAGYLIRPECAQLVVLGSLWCGLQIFRSKSAIAAGQAVSALVLLLAAFLVIAGPYMKLKGAIFPKKDVGRFTVDSKRQEVYPASTPAIPPDIGELSRTTAEASRFAPMKIAAALGKLAGNVSQTLMWFFVLPLLIGMYKWFGKRKWHEPEKFFIIVFVVVNILAMIWLYCKFGYMSDRHNLPLTVVFILFVPAGIQEWALWLERKFSNKVEPSAAASHNQRLYFLVLLIIGFCICVPKLLKPIRIEEQGYRAAADWLKANTKSTDVIAVPDKRINFYAERTGLVYVKGNIPARAAYVVKEIEANAAKESTENLDKAEYQYVDKRKKRVNIAIYRNF